MATSISSTQPPVIQGVDSKEKEKKPEVGRLNERTVQDLSAEPRNVRSSGTLEENKKLVALALQQSGIAISSDKESVSNEQSNQTAEWLLENLRETKKLLEEAQHQ